MTVADDSRVVDDEGEEAVPVTAHTSSPDRTVFTEQGNTEAWISTDTTVELQR